jgi:hypothetical protein
MVTGVVGPYRFFATEDEARAAARRDSMVGPLIVGPFFYVVRDGRWGGVLAITTRCILVNWEGRQRRKDMRVVDWADEGIEWPADLDPATMVTGVVGPYRFFATEEEARAAADGA